MILNPGSAIGCVTKPGLKSADFTLAAWLNLENGDITGGDVFFSQGAAHWQDGGDGHRLDVSDLAMHLSRQGGGWQLDVPKLNIATDGASWAPGALSLFWQPEKNRLFAPDQAGEIRLRAKDLMLKGSVRCCRWCRLSRRPYAPAGRIAAQGHLVGIGVGCAAEKSGKIRFQGRWQDVAWRQWQLLPGADHVAGSVAGTLADGEISIALDNSTQPYQCMFRAPLAVQKARVTLDWQK